MIYQKKPIVKIFFFLSILISLSACDKFVTNELICKPNKDSKILTPYEIVQIKNLQKRICIQYFGAELTCIPFDGHSSVEDFYDKDSKLIINKNTFTSKVSNSAYSIVVTEKWKTAVEVDVKRLDKSTLFIYKNTNLEIQKKGLSETEIETLKIITLIKHVYGINVEIESPSFKKYTERYLGTSKVWEYYLDKYTKELSSNGDLKDYSDIYRYKCETPSDKL